MANPLSRNNEEMQLVVPAPAMSTAVSISQHSTTPIPPQRSASHRSVGFAPAHDPGNSHGQRQEPDLRADQILRKAGTLTGHAKLNRAVKLIGTQSLTNGGSGALRKMSNAFQPEAPPSTFSGVFDQEEADAGTRRSIAANEMLAAKLELSNESTLVDIFLRFGATDPTIVHPEQISGGGPLTRDHFQDHYLGRNQWHQSLLIERDELPMELLYLDPRATSGVNCAFSHDFTPDRDSDDESTESMSPLSPVWSSPFGPHTIGRSDGELVSFAHFVQMFKALCASAVDTGEHSEAQMERRLFRAADLKWKPQKSAKKKGSKTRTYSQSTLSSSAASVAPANPENSHTRRGARGASINPEIASMPRSRLFSTISTGGLPSMNEAEEEKTSTDLMGRLDKIGAPPKLLHFGRPAPSASEMMKERYSNVLSQHMRPRRPARAGPSTARSKATYANGGLNSARKSKVDINTAASQQKPAFVVSTPRLHLSSKEVIYSRPHAFQTHTRSQPPVLSSLKVALATSPSSSCIDPFDAVLEQWSLEDGSRNPQSPAAAGTPPIGTTPERDGGDEYALSPPSVQKSEVSVMANEAARWEQQELEADGNIPPPVSLFKMVREFKVHPHSYKRIYVRRPQSGASRSPVPPNARFIPAKPSSPQEEQPSSGYRLTAPTSSVAPPEATGSHDPDLVMGNNYKGSFF